MTTFDLSPIGGELFAGRDARRALVPTDAFQKLTKMEGEMKAPGFAEMQLDRHASALWLSGKLQRPAQEVLSNFDAYARAYWGKDVTPGQAYDRIVEYERTAMQMAAPAPQAGAKDGAKGEQATPDANARKSWQFMRAATGGFAKAGHDTAGGTLALVEGAMNTLGGMPDRKGVSEDPDFSDALFKLGVMEYDGTLDTPEGAMVKARVDAGRARLDEDFKARMEEYRATIRGGLAADVRAGADFFYELGNESAQFYGVSEEYRASTIGKVAEAGGSMVASSALLAAGSLGFLGKVKGAAQVAKRLADVAGAGQIYAGVEQDRMAVEGDAYRNAGWAFASNLANAGVQQVIERVPILDNTLERALKHVPHKGGVVKLGDVLREMRKEAIRSGFVEAGEEVIQGAWDDFIVDMSYDDTRVDLSDGKADYLKRRVGEAVAGFGGGVMLGGTFGGAAIFDRNQAAKKAERAFASRAGEMLTPEDLAHLRRARTDEQIKAMPWGETLLAAANGDAKAAEAYNRAVFDASFVRTDGLAAFGDEVGEYKGMPAVRLSDGRRVPIDMADPEQVARFNAFRRQVAAAASGDAAVAEFQRRFGEGLTTERPAQASSLEEMVKAGTLTQEQAEDAKAVAVAMKKVAADAPLSALFPEGSARAVEDSKTRLVRMVTSVLQGKNAAVAIEETAEAWIQAAVLKGDVDRGELRTLRMDWQQANGETPAEGASEARADVEWFSRRVIEYALAGKVTEVTGSKWWRWIRTLGEQLRDVLKGAQKMRAALKDGTLDPRLEGWFQAALGMGEDSMRQADATLRAKEAEGAAQIPLAEMDPVTVQEAMAAETFPKITGNVDDGFQVTAPDGSDIGAAQDLEAAQEKAMEWWMARELAAERNQAKQDAGQDKGDELMDVIRRLGGLRAASVEGTMRGELKTLAENMGTAERLRTFRKSGKDLDRLREGLVEEGFDFQRPADVLDAIERSLKGQPQYATYSNPDSLLAGAGSFSLKQETRAAFADQVRRQRTGVSIDARSRADFSDTAVELENNPINAWDRPPERAVAQTASGVSHFEEERFADGYKGHRFVLVKDGKGIAYLTVQEMRGNEERRRAASFVIHKAYTTEANRKQGGMSRLIAEADKAFPGALEPDYLNTEEMLGVMRRMAGPTFSLKQGEFQSRTLYRAASDPEAGSGAHFTESKRDAEAYTDNPGFGGPNVYRFDVQMEAPLALSQRNAYDLKSLAQAVGEIEGLDAEAISDLAQSWRDSGYATVFNVLENARGVERTLAEKHDWIRFIDDFPEGSTTWKYLGGEKLFGGAADGAAGSFSIKQGEFSGMDGGRGPGKNQGELPLEYHAARRKIEDTWEKWMASQGYAELVRMRDETYVASLVTARAKHDSASMAGLESVISPVYEAIRRAGAPEVSAALVRNTQQAAQRKERDRRVVRALAEKMQRLDESVAFAFDAARLNGDLANMQSIADRYGFRAELDGVLAMFDRIRQEALVAGVPIGTFWEKPEEVADGVKAKLKEAGRNGAAIERVLKEAGYRLRIETYWPRHVIDYDAYLSYLSGTKPGSSELARAYAAALAKAQGRPLTADELDLVASKGVAELKRRAVQGGGKPSALKRRKIEEVALEAVRFYKKPIDSAYSHVERMHDYVAMMSFFGDKARVDDPAVDGALPVLNVKETLEHYLETRREQLTAAQVEAIRAALQARFTYVGSPSIINTVKTLGYLQGMTQLYTPLTAVFPDMWSIALESNANLSTFVSAIYQAATGESAADLSSFGLNAREMHREFQTQMGGRLARFAADKLKLKGKTRATVEAITLANTLDGILRVLGLNKFNDFVQRSRANAELIALRKASEAGKLSRIQQSRIERFFLPAERKQLLADVAAGKGVEESDLVASYVWAGLADYMPISLDQMPEQYLKNPKGRIFYMYKTFLVMQTAAIRRESIDSIVDGVKKKDPKLVAYGVGTLMAMVSFLLAFSMPPDMVRAYLQNRPYVLEDELTWKLMGLAGVSHFVAQKVRQDATGAAAAYFAPPTSIIPDAIRDAQDIWDGNLAGDVDGFDFTKLRVWNYTPIIGRTYQGWFGSDSEKRQKELEASEWFQLRADPTKKEASEAARRRWLLERYGQE